MPLPLLPSTRPEDTPEIASERQRDYVMRLRGELEGYEGSVSNFVEQGGLWGTYPPGATNLITDPSFEINRGSWSVPIGVRVFEDTANARSGNYLLRLDSAEGYATGNPDGGLIYPNAGTFTPCLPSQMFLCGGFVVGASGATGNAQANLVWYDADKSIISFVSGTALAINTGWQFIWVKGIAPAGTAYVQAQYRINSLSGAAAFDDMELFVVHQLLETASAGVVNFSSVAETVLASVAMGPLIQTAGAAGVISPVIIMANSVFHAAAGAGTNITYRIRRTNVSGTVLQIANNLVGANGSMYMIAIDTAPNVTSETWVLTGQMATADGGVSDSHRIIAWQIYR